MRRHPRRQRTHPAAGKRALDVAVAALGLLGSAPVLLPVMYLVWRQDGHSPFYVAERVGKDGEGFRMVKLRSMVVGADRSGVDSTAADDMRITPVGQFIRRYKLDELTQLWNVLRGEMSLVGPRPNVRWATDMYTSEERRLLSVKPGITDLASIVFSDEAEILKGSQDPDRSYDELIRPGKSRLGLYYVDHMSIGMDLCILVLTAVAIMSQRSARVWVVHLLHRRGANPELAQLATRSEPLIPLPPPGAPRSAGTESKCNGHMTGGGLSLATRNDRGRTTE